MSLPQEMQLILNLAKARELLLRDAETHMPKGAAAQRKDTLDVLEKWMDDLLQSHDQHLPNKPEGLDAISEAAWHYVESRAALPHKAPQPIEKTAYEHLKDVFDQRGKLFIANETLGWMEDTHADTIPEIDRNVIAEGKSAIQVLMHRLITQASVAQWLEEAQTKQGKLSSDDQRNLALMQSRWQEANGQDPALVENLSLAISASGDAWEEAKKSGDFAKWLPHFQEVTTFIRQKANAVGNTLGVSPYQALLNAYNYELSEETINRIFQQLRSELPQIVQQAMDMQGKEEPAIPLPSIPVQVQKQLARKIMQKLGLDENHARLDTSAHPCANGQYDDARITTRYDESNVVSALTAIIHEAGHALYQSGLSKDWKYQPLGDEQSMWVHETQSLFWENQVAHSPEFMEFLAPIIKNELRASCPDLDLNGPQWSPENLLKLISRVEPSYIRIEADELTYPAHILLRHELEQKIVAGTLAPEDVPAAWNEGFKALLGLDVENDAQGCMQDVHWPQGLFGYFPAYSFGAIGAAQLMEKMKADIPKVSELIREGNFAPIRAWLGEHIHQQGSRYSGEELIARATGKPLSVEPFLNHLRERYLGSAEVSATPANVISGAERANVLEPAAPPLPPQG